jgi:glycosyltransferase involved in cell wall biosynthesis
LRESLKPSSLYQSHFGNNNKNIVFIGRLTKVKRFDLLIDAISKLNKRGEFVNVTFVGDGVERQNMERRVNELGIQNQVWFYGACYDEGINAELIYNADLCVSPGNIGLTAMHVMMFGCPAITNDDFNHQMPEFEAILEGESGTFFKAGDSSSLSDCISQWFRIHNNDRESVRQSCYKVINSKWNPHNQISILKKILLL